MMEDASATYCIHLFFFVFNCLMFSTDCSFQLQVDAQQLKRELAFGNIIIQQKLEGRGMNYKKHFNYNLINYNWNTNGIISSQNSCMIVSVKDVHCIILYLTWFWNL